MASFIEQASSLGDYNGGFCVFSLSMHIAFICYSNNFLHKCAKMYCI